MFRAVPATDDNYNRSMRFACWMPKATNTNSDCVILIAFTIANAVARTRLNVALYVHCLTRFVSIMAQEVLPLAAEWANLIMKKETNQGHSDKQN